MPIIFNDQAPEFHPRKENPKIEMSLSPPPPALSKETTPVTITKDELLSLMRTNFEHFKSSRTALRRLTEALSLTSLPQLQAAYGVIWELLTTDVERLRQSVEDGCDLMMADSATEQRQRQARIILLASSLQHLIRAKNSLIVMMGLSPSLFQLLLLDLYIGEEWFATLYPETHFQILKQAHALVKTHDYYVASSSWLISSFSDPLAAKGIERGHSTREYAAIQIRTLARLLRIQNMWTETRTTISAWLSGILNQLPDEALLTRVMKRDEWRELRRALRDSLMEDGQVDKSLHAISTRLFQVVAYTTDEAIDTTQLVIQKIRRCDNETAWRIWPSMNMKLYVSSAVSRLGWERLESAQCRIASSFFCAEDFLTLINFLLKREVPTLTRNPIDEENWIASTIALLYNGCQLETKGKEADKKQLPLSISEHWQWALTQTAYFCVANKMKTPIGKPMETFNQISTELQSLARKFLSYGASKGKENREKERDKEKDREKERDSKKERSKKEPKEDEESALGEPRKLSSTEDWLRVRFLLEFFERLERLIFFIAENGTVFPLCTVQQPVRNFFVTNLMSCQEWLARAYLPAMVVAYYNGSFAQVIRFGWAALVDVEKKLQKAQQKISIEKKPKEERANEQEIEGVEIGKEERPEKSASPSAETNGNSTDEKKIPNPTLVLVIWMGRAMIELENEQAISGLIEWCRGVYSITQVPRLFEGMRAMASGRYELALIELNTAYTEQELTESVKAIIREMILDCYTHLRMPELIQEEMAPPQLFAWRHLVNSESGEPANDIDADAINRVRQLTIFSKSERVVTGAKRITSDLVSCSTRELLRWESILTLTLRRTDVVQMQEDMTQLARMLLIADAGQRTHGRLALVNLISNCVLKKMQKNKNGETISTETILSDIDPSFVLAKEDYRDTVERLRFTRSLILWADRLASENLVHRPDIMIESAKLARKTSNILLAKSYLKQASNSIIALQQKQLDQQEFHPACVQLQILTQNAKMLWDSSPTERPMNLVSTFSTLVATYNIALQLKNMGASLDVSSPLAGKINSHVHKTNVEMAKTCIRLATWAEQMPSLVMPVEFSITNFWNDLQACGKEIGGNLPGSLLYLATQMCPKLAKAQRHFGEWSLRAAAELYSEQRKADFVQQYRVLLTYDTSAMESLWECLKNATSIEQLSHDVVNVKYDPAVTALLVSPESALVTRWHANRNFIRLYYSQAITAFYRYLVQSDLTIKGNINTLSTTLRILELLVKESEMLGQQILEQMQTTNVHLWKDILPQLLSRLSHPSPKVRMPIIVLLSRICQAAPHTIVYQVVSGASSAYAADSQPNAAVTPEDGGQPESKAMAAINQRNEMIAACRQLTDYLARSYPKLVNDVKEFVTQLQNISLLNEEKWAFILVNLDHEMDKRLEQIRVETAKTRAVECLDEQTKDDIIKRKQTLFTKQVYTVLNDLFEKTIAKSPPLTNNESEFVDECGHLIRTAIELSRGALAALQTPEKAWAPFKQALIKLQQRISRRGAYTLQIGDISEYLAKLHKTTIPMPGQEMLDFSEIVTISQVMRSAFVLPTKTRPKKLLFLGSDGSEQTFLFKSREDLHLDERIMQLLEISNQILSSAKMKREYPSYFARHYAVTPFGGRCGLIQWVKGATPLFYIYRKWQSRQASNKTDTKQQRQMNADADRPSDMFQKKLRAAFIENNVESDIMADRNKWPQSILKDVLKSLINETPNNLLSRELWIRSGSCDTWWAVTQRFARSCAVMSMIGAILGIGDRHLDNLLVNLATGELVHIDYNICFDKGKNLRVPETVPFRLTQNIVNALGPTQIEGTYRNSCARVLEALRERSQVLSTVLDTFVYDPLVDWTTLPTGGSSTDSFTALFSSAVGIAINLAVYGTMDVRQQEPFEIAREMFCVKIRELGESWMMNCHDLFGALEDVKVALELQLPNQEARVHAGQRLKAALSKHHQMMKEFRPMLRILALKDERVSNYLNSYRRLFSEPIIRGHQQLETVQESNLPLASCPPEFADAAGNLKGLCQCLLFLDKPDAVPPELKPTLLPLMMNSERGSPTTTHTDAHFSAANDKQEANAHAKSLMRRVRQRLEGRIANGNTQLLANFEHVVVSPEEQSNSWIRHAISLTLLAQMYEGWTAWV